MSDDLVALINFLKRRGKTGICVAFSGGVDSAVVLKAAVMSGVRVHAVTFKTVLHPEKEIKGTVKLAKQIKAPHTILEINEFDNKKITDNTIDRCYHCKYMLFQELKKFARMNKLGRVMDGTNVDDLLDYRPGLKALQELKIVSPLADLSIDKDTVREIAREMNLPVSDKPSAPCLATRIPYNVPINPDSLTKIALGEEYLKRQGFKVVRIRLHGDVARIEIPKNGLSKFLSQKDQIINQLKKLGFVYVALDLEGFRSGSMDAVIEKRG